jgi:hypothetical protein
MEEHGINNVYLNLQHRHRCWLCRHHDAFFLYLRHRRRNLLELLAPSNCHLLQVLLRLPALLTKNGQLFVSTTVLVASASLVVNGGSRNISARALHSYMFCMKYWAFFHLKLLILIKLLLLARLLNST